MSVGFVADRVDVVLAKLFDQQFAQNTGRGDEGFGLAPQNADGPRNVNTTTTRIDLSAVTAKFRADYDLVNRA